MGEFLAPEAQASAARRRTLALAVFGAGYVPLLIILPRLFPPDPNFPSAAAHYGYSPDIAFIAAAVWSVIGFGFLAVAFLRGWLQPPKLLETVAQRPSGLPLIVELGVSVIAPLLLYFPPFLARYSHYLEDNYFMAALLRMNCGQRPFTDFEWPYGPLMIVPLHGWMRLFGFSMTTYYAFIVVLEALMFAVLVLVLRHFLPDARRRYVALAILLPFVINTLLGLNWNAWRRLLGVYSLLLVAVRPLGVRSGLAAGALLGFYIAWSHEYGLVALCAILGIYGVMFLGPERWRAFRQAVLVGGVSVGVWLLSVLSTGTNLSDYFATTLYIIHVMAQGVQSFRFYWTLNSLASFGLLACSLAAIAVGISRSSKEPLSSGDRYLLGSVLFAVLALKSGLNRADIWHFGASFLPLTFAALSPLPTRLFKPNLAGRHLPLTLCVITSVTYLIGILPTGSYLVEGLTRGAIDAVGGLPLSSIESRKYSLESQRSHPHPNHVELAKYFAEDVRSKRPVFYFGDDWWVALHAGTCALGYHVNRHYYSEERVPKISYLQANPEAFVVVPAYAYRNIFEGVTEPYTRDPQDTVTKKLASWLSTVHYGQGPLEGQIVFKQWADDLGGYLRTNYQRAADFDDIVVLETRIGAGQ